VAPSLTQTPATESLLNSEEKQKRMAQRHPLGRVGQPEDIAQAITFLLSERSSWMTGQVIGVDGGYGSVRQ
jgi:NAD(P)-dependent dehydrogenase (short-subunit alcohol dehydrogenase family)